MRTDGPIREAACSASPQGRATMSPAMEDMEAYPRYLYGLLAPGLKSCRRVWEIGVGHGQYTQLLLEDRFEVVATDISTECLQRLEERLVGRRGWVALPIDLNRRDSLLPVADLGVDGVICLNVLEHLSDDVAALASIGQTVAPGGVLGIVVPAFPSLYGPMDAQAGHFRRYTTGSLRTALKRAGWEVERIDYRNAIPALGWWYHNRIRKGTALEDPTVQSQMRWLDQWIPRMAAWTDPLFKQYFGLSVVAIARTKR
ncbi:MAG: class I SAM-dependent methyltransferase [Pirellulaceae bacterium]